MRRAASLLLLVALSGCGSPPTDAEPPARPAPAPSPPPPPPTTRPSAAPAPPDEADLVEVPTYRVPVGTSPVRGEATALVTMVMFAEFECPYCVAVMPTVTRLEGEYGRELRVVFKHSPQTPHPRSELAAGLAVEARVQQGDAGFWKVHDLLWARKGKFGDHDFEEIAAAAGLDAGAAVRAALQQRHRDAIHEDASLGERLGAMGTPTFFINGRLLIGAQPIENFRAVIDRELRRAQREVERGTPRAAVYEVFQKRATFPRGPR